VIHMSLNRRIDDRLSSLALPSQPSSLYDPIRYTIALGGKRIRPHLVALSCGLQGHDPENALDAAIAVELLHTFTLIHDDIMDNADTRRGQPTVYRKWNTSVAILSGDALFTVAIRQLAAYATHPAYGRIMDRFLEGIQLVCEGQALDMDFETRTDVTLIEYLRMIELKTSVLLQVGMELGAWIGGADADAVVRTGHIGLQAGLAFQIQDDLLDATADPRIFGKKAAGDIREGKKTYLTLLLLERCDRKEARWVQTMLKQKSASDSDVTRMLELYRDYGIFAHTEDMIRTGYRTAGETLERFRPSESKTGIRDILTQLSTRES
jgi:geranylgeranyl diphosphate synthase type II